MESLFEQFGGTYRKESDYIISNLEMPVLLQPLSMVFCA